MIKRRKKQVTLEKAIQMRAQGKKLDAKTTEALDSFATLSATLKHDLPKLSTLTHKLAILCHAQLVHIQTQWFDAWRIKITNILKANQIPYDWANLLQHLQMDQPPYIREVETLGLLNQQQAWSQTESSSIKGRPSIVSSRSRNTSLHSEKSPAAHILDQHRGIGHQGSYFGFDGTDDYPPLPPNPPVPPAEKLAMYERARRPESSRQSTDREEMIRVNVHNSMQNGFLHTPYASNRSSISEGYGQASGFTILYLAASLFEFDVETVNTESGYPYLNYPAGEVRPYSRDLESHMLIIIDI